MFTSIRYYQGILKTQFFIRNHCPITIMPTWLTKTRAKTMFSGSRSRPSHSPPVCFARARNGARNKNKPIKNGTTTPPRIAEWLTISWIPTKYQGALAGLGGCKGSARSERGASIKRANAMSRDRVRRPTVSSARKSQGADGILSVSSPCGAAKPPSFRIRQR